MCTAARDGLVAVIDIFLAFFRTAPPDIPVSTTMSRFRILAVLVLDHNGHFVSGMRGTITDTVLDQSAYGGACLTAAVSGVDLSITAAAAAASRLALVVAGCRGAGAAAAAVAICAARASAKAEHSKRVCDGISKSLSSLQPKRSSF